MRLAVLTALFLTTVTFNATADEAPGITIFPHIGQTYGDDSQGLDDGGHVGVGVGYRFDSPWGVELTYQRAELDFDTPLTGEADVDTWHLGGLYHLGSRDDIVPFLAIGVGRSDYDTDFYGDETETQLNAGIGFKWFVREKMAIRSDFRFIEGNDDDSIDAAISFGLHFPLGGSRSPAPMAASPVSAPAAVAGDADGDGVSDDSDRCPNTPRGVDVDSNGCPRDDDGDGVYNYMDDCPNTTNRRARIDERGCYIRLEEKVEITLNVEFDFDSAAPRDEHQAEVRKVADFMEEYPDTTVVMEGHTDDIGPEAYNQNLSERRARAIADMLIEKFGINTNRVSSRGHGESMPIASNDTAEGRQDNRRVVAGVEGEKEEIELK